MNGLLEVWNSMNPAARLRAGIFGAVIAVGTIAAAVWVLSDSYETLFSAMEPQDAAAVIAELDRMGVPYRLGADGGQIDVPASKVREVRVKLMGTGVPLRGGVGFEIFDQAGLGVTEFTQKINYQRALEGELSRTISSLKEVKYARVHLVMPESSLFQKQKAQPSASITLFLKQGVSLDDGRVAGLQRLVSASVPGLEPKAVVITDQSGAVLSRKVEEDEEGQAVTARLQKKREIEAYVGSKVRDVLDRALGAGRAVISVDVTLNLDQVKTTREEVIPHGDPQKEVLRRRESTSSAGGAVPGQKENVVSEVEYMLGRKVEQVVAAPGAIERINVGVLVPDEIAASRLDEIRSLVAMTVGLNPGRGDAVAVFAGDLTLRVPNASAGTALPDGTAPGGAGEAAAVPGERSIVPGWLFERQVTVVVGAVLLLVLIAFMAFARREKPRRLRQDERDLILHRLQQWSAGEGQMAEKGPA